MTLYELTEDYRQLALLAEEEELDADIFKDTMDGITGAIEDKAENYAKIIKNLQAEVDAYKAEIDRMMERKKVIDKNIDRMKETLENALILTDRRKFKTNLFSFAIQKNPPSVEVYDESQIAAEFFLEQAPKLDKKALLEQLKAGKQIYGCELKQTESLRIR